MTGVDSSPPVIVAPGKAAQYTLALGVAAGQVGRDVVFLDLTSDQYSCLRGNPGLWLEGVGLHVGSAEMADALVAANLIRPSTSCTTSPDTPLCRPTRDVRVQDVPLVRISEFRDFLACWVEALTQFRGRAIATLQRQVRRSAGALPLPDDRRLVRRVSVFEALLPWIPFPGACLFRSYMLLRFLQRGGCDANWMIGVRTWPFEAHCWLQLEDVALDDRSERLVRFQPILAL